MKRQGYIYKDICDIKNVRSALISALISASKSKTKKFAVQNALKNFEENVTFVKSLLDNKSYIPNKYYPATIKDGISGKERTIYKPKFFPDQVIHWCLINK